MDHLELMLDGEPVEGRCAAEMQQGDGTWTPVEIEIQHVVHDNDAAAKLVVYGLTDDPEDGIAIPFNSALRWPGDRHGGRRSSLHDLLPPSLMPTLYPGG